jgi:signal peptidase II
MPLPFYGRLQPGMVTSGRSLPAYLALVGIAAVVLVLDQISKAIVARSLRGHAPVQMLGGLFQLDYTRNTGAAFSIFPNGGWFFAVIAAAVIAGILIYFPRVRHHGTLVTLAFGLILGGAIGNLVDRLRLGYVVDFIDFRWFPVFNLADSAIVCGAGVLILASYLSSGGTD